MNNCLEAEAAAGVAKPHHSGVVVRPKAAGRGGSMATKTLAAALNPKAYRHLEYGMPSPESSHVKATKVIMTYFFQFVYHSENK